MMKKIMTLLCIAALALGAQAADGDAARKSTIHLKNGQYVTGIIISRTSSTVEIVPEGEEAKYVYDMDDVNYIEHERRHKNYDTAKFRGFIDGGYSLGVGSPRNDYWLIETSFGYAITPQVYLGAGLGVHSFNAVESSYPLYWDQTATEHQGLHNDPDWKYPFIPLYVNGRYNLKSESQNTLFVDLKVGATFINHKGFFASPTVGYHFASTEFFSFNVGFGYALQTATYKKWCSGDTPGARPDGSGKSYLKPSAIFHNLLLKVGVEF